MSSGRGITPLYVVYGFLALGTLVLICEDDVNIIEAGAQKTQKERIDNQVILNGGTFRCSYWYGLISFCGSS